LGNTSYCRQSRTTRSISRDLDRGNVLLEISGSTTEIISITTQDRRYKFEPKGPYKIPANGKAIEIKVVEVGEKPPDEPPNFSLIHDLPKKEVVTNTKPAVAGKDVKLWYKNEADRNLKLFLFDCTWHYDGRDGFRYDFPLDRSKEFKLWDRFSSDSSGWFGFVVRDLETGKDFHLGCFQVFGKKSTNLTVSGSADQYVAKFD
jgi:hypothetical protein